MNVRLALVLLTCSSQSWGCLAIFDLLFGSNDQVRVSNEDTDPVPVSVQDATLSVQVQNTIDLASPVSIQPRVPVSASGEWTAAGLSGIPSTLIIHDLFIYANSDSTPDPCEFVMSYVIDNIQSRTIRRWSLQTGETAELHFEAGIAASQLRFGTINSGCVRHWMVLGYNAA